MGEELAFGKYLPTYLYRYNNELAAGLVPLQLYLQLSKYKIAYYEERICKHRVAVGLSIVRDCVTTKVA